MKIKVAGHSGFCFGVKRAINIAEKTLKSSEHRKDIYSLGPIIHNPQVVDSLSRKGLCVIDGIDSLKKGVVIISSHGAPKDLIQRIKKKKLALVDATCPFVKCAHNIVKDLKKQHYRVIIVGDKKHPEVKALLSLAGDPFALTLSPKGRGKGGKRKIGIISQTTQNRHDYLREISDILKDDFNEVRIFNTICNDTAHRQILTRKLLDECDVMIVIGGKNSANTRRLWQICREGRADSYHIEKEAELKRKWFIDKDCVGVVSGASTPDSMVKKAVERIRRLTNID